MKIAVMQPYLFPYIGYFQLIQAVDYFGIGDDVQYIQKGWINRNRILMHGKDCLFSFPIKKDSHNLTIDQRYFADNFVKEKDKFLRKLELAYKKAPSYQPTIKIINEIFDFEDLNLSRFIENQLRIICDYLEIKTSFLSSKTWQITNDRNLSVEERVVRKIEKLKHLNIDHYINPIGGTSLYNKEYFKKKGYKLNFIKSSPIVYKQFKNEFIENLSIIDVLMFNSKDKVKEYLSDFELI